MKFNRLLLILFLLIFSTTYAQSGGSGTASSIFRTTFANLLSQSNGSVRYCTDCQATSPCTSGGTGAMASRVNGAWTCSTGGSSSVSPFLGPNGTAALPAFSFTSDPDTGIYRKSANQIGFATLGTERATITNGGINIFGGSVLTINGATSGAISFGVPATITSYGLTWPSAAPPTNQYGTLVIDSFGATSFISSYSIGTPGIAGNGTLNTGSRNSAGKITATGTGASTIVLTFSSSATFANAPACLVTNETTANLVRPVSTTATLTINATIVTGDSIAYICIGY